MKTIECTPTWSDLLPMLLEIFLRSDNKETIKSVGKELAKMAQAADNWNEFCVAKKENKA